MNRRFFGSLFASGLALFAALTLFSFWLYLPARPAAAGEPARTAGTLLVNSTNDADDGSCDSSHCSLREAITAANGSAGPDTIAFALTLPATITLQSALPAFNGPLAIEGPPGAGPPPPGSGVTISGSGLYRIFSIGSGAVTLSDLHLTAGVVTGDGGAIYSSATALLLERVTFTANSAGHQGGGLSNFGTATVTGGFFSGNEAQEGAAIDSYGTLTVTASHFIGNQATIYGGAAIYNVTGDVTVSSSFFENNLSTTSGGAIVNGQWAPARMTIQDSVFANNSAFDDGGAIYNPGTLTVRASHFLSNHASLAGGALASTQPAGWATSPQATVENSHFQGNSATTSGGGIMATGGLTLANSLLQANEAAFGGALALGGTATAYGTTFFENDAVYTGGGAYLSAGTYYVFDSTFSGNTAGDQGGGLINFGTLSLGFATVASNRAVGDAAGLENRGTLHLGSSILAYNRRTNDQPADCASNEPGATIQTNIYNLIQDNRCNTVASGSVLDFIAADPLLAPLAPNGGPSVPAGVVPTHALLPGSPAIDSSDTFTTALDQRGAPRYQDGDLDGTPDDDRGAYELIGFHLHGVLYSSSNVSLTWNDVGESAYELWRSDQPYGPYPPLATVPAPNAGAWAAADDPDLNFYFAVSGERWGGISNHLGVFTFGLVPGQ